MEERSWQETIKVEGGQILDQVKKLIEEGNVRRIVIKQGSRTVAEFPLTFGVVGAVFAPMLAAVGAVAALITECSIEVTRVETPPDSSESDSPAAPDGHPGAMPGA